MDLSDIERTKPQQLKQNKITNIRDNKINVTDIDSPKYVKFKTNRVSDPLNPTYKMETASRRHVLNLGQIEGSAPKDFNSIPPEKKMGLSNGASEMIYNPFPKNTDRRPPI